MPSLGSLWYNMGIRDLTDADLQKINKKLQDLGASIKLTPKLSTAVSDILPRGVKLELDPKLRTVTNEALAKAVEGKVMKVEVTPLLTHLRKALKDATVASPPEIEVGIQAVKLRTLIESVLNKHGFMINISTVNDNYTKVVQQKLNGTPYKVKIHADAREITQSVQASFMQMQSRHFGLQVSRDILYRSIDEALGHKRFNINIAVQHDQARKAVQDALLRAQVIGKDQALAYQRLQTGEMKAAQAELLRLKAAQHEAASAAKAHATASVNLGGAMGRNITIAGELGSAMTSLYSIHAAKQFLSQVIEIGGELEHQKIAMDTIFGDKGKTNELYGQIKGLARQSPFGVMELTKSVKALSAYGVQYNEIYDTAKRLADISAATSVDINRLILAFGKTKSRGFLDGLEAKQFAYANIPIYEMVRKKLEELEGQAVTTQEVMERMRKREISFGIVKDVLWDITDPGGKFYDMQEALAGSVKTSWKLVRDNIELMFGEIAESAVGDGLKSVAEILQALTRNWRLVGSVVAAAAVGLGIYKVATIGVNSAVQKSTITTYNQIIAQKRKNAEELKAWGRITQLDKAEKMRIVTANKLVNADLRAALMEGKLTDKHIAQLFWQKKITAEQVKHLANIGLLDPAMAKAILRNNRFTLSLQMMRQGLIRAGAAMKAFLFNPWTITTAALMGGTALYQHMSEQSDKAKEFGENLSTKAAEGARNLTEALKGLNGEFSNMSETKLSDTVEKLEQAIKDYGIFADKTLFYSKIDDNGMVRTMEQRAQYLYQQAKILEEAYTKFKDWKVGDMAARASEATNGDLWPWHWYEGLHTDIEDYVKDVRNAQKELTNYLRDHEDEAKLVVKFAADIDPEFKKLTGEMGVEQAMNALVSNLDRLQNVYENFPREQGRLKIGDHDFNNFAHLSEQFLNNWTSTDVKHSMEEVLREQDTFMASLKKDILSKDKDFFKNLTDEKKVMLGMAFQEAFRGMEGLDDQYIMPFVQRWNDYFGTAFDPFFIEGQIQSQFSSLIPDLGDDLAKKVRNGEQLEKAEEEKVKAIFDKAVTMVKNAWPGKAAEIQQIVDDPKHQIRANVLLAVNQRSGMDAWQKELDDAFGNNHDITVKIKGEADTQSTLKALAEMKKETKAALDKFALTFNIKPNFGKLEKQGFGALLPGSFQWKQVEEYNKLVDLWNDIAKGEKQTGINLDDWNKTKDKGNDKGSPKDPFSDAVKERISLLKKAKSEYESLAKSIGTEAASKELADSPIFAGLKANKFLPEQDIPKTLDEYEKALDKLQEQLTAKGLKTQKHRELNIEIEQVKLDIKKKKIDDSIKLALDKVSKEAERQLADWNLFDKIRKATGDEKLAMSIGFGLNADAETDYPKLIEQQLDKQTKAYETALAKKNKGYTVQGYTYASLKELYDKANAEGATDADMNAWLAVPDKIREAWEKANGDILKYFDQQREAVANILSEYQTLQDKINGINAKRDRDIAAVNQQHRDEKTGEMVYDIPDGDERKRLEGLINAKADWEIFQKSSDYMSFFNDIYGLTLQKAQQIGDAIQMHLNDQLQRGLITIYEYEQQMEKVRKQLDAMRNIKSDAMTFLTGGVKGLNDKRLAKAQGELTQNPQYKAMLEKQFKLQQEIEEARKNGDEESLKNKQKDLDKLNEELKVFTKIRDAIVKNQEQWQDVLDVVNIAANIAGGISDAFNSIRDMADALGFDTESNAWLNVGGVIDTLTSVTGGISKAVQSAMKGDIGGIISGTFDTLLSPITIWSKLHDKKLQKQIEESQRVYDLLDKQLALIADRLNFALGSSKQITDPQAERDTARYDEAVRRSQRNDSVPGMPSFYGPIYKRIADKLRPRVEAYKEGGVYAYQRQLMAEQIASLTNQRNAEADKKDSDSNAIADYNNQIASLQQQIRDFAESTIETLYGINIRSFAEDIGSALIDAFAKGEDAAEAFDRAVGDIMRDVVKQMAIKNILEKQFEGMRTFLFGADGMSGAFGADFYIDKDEAAALKAYFDEIKDSIPKVKDLFDSVNEATGGLLTDTESKSGLSAGIQSVTEDTADLLASYLNATRADVSEQTHILWPRLLDDVLPQMNIIAQSQLDYQRQIAENTMRNAVAAEAIVVSAKAIAESNDEINRLLARVTQGASKFYVH